MFAGYTDNLKSVRVRWKEGAINYLQLQSEK